MSIYNFSRVVPKRFHVSWKNFQFNNRNNNSINLLVRKIIPKLDVSRLVEFGFVILFTIIRSRTLQVQIHLHRGPGLRKFGKVISGLGNYGAILRLDLGLSSPDPPQGRSYRIWIYHFIYTPPARTLAASPLIVFKPTMNMFHLYLYSMLHMFC